MNKLYVSLFALAMFTGPAMADRVYYAESGVWAVSGYANNPNPNEVSCVLSTEYVENNNKIQINVFPKRNGKTNLTMSLRNDSWDGRSQNKNERYTGDVVFVNNGLQYQLPFEWQWFPNNNYQTIIVRDLSRDFLDQFQVAEEMTFFPHTDDEWRLGLFGSQAASRELLTDCLLTVTNE